MKYRSEIPFGEGYRDAIDVMTHEIYELWNSDIPLTVLNSDLNYSDELRREADELNTCIQESNQGNLISKEDIYDFCKRLLEEILILTGKNIKYVLWLAEKDAVINYYGQNDNLTEEDVDAYEESDIIISDCGYDGCLYGYEKLPKSLTKEQEQILVGLERYLKVVNDNGDDICPIYTKWDELRNKCVATVTFKGHTGNEWQKNIWIENNQLYIEDPLTQQDLFDYCGEPYNNWTQEDINYIRDCNKQQEIEQEIGDER